MRAPSSRLSEFSGLAQRQPLFFRPGSAFRTEEYNLTGAGAGNSERLHGHMISSGFFFGASGINRLMLEAQHSSGRRNARGRSSGGGDWRRALAGSAEVFGYVATDVLGKSITLNRGKMAYTVIRRVATCRATLISRAERRDRRVCADRAVDRIPTFRTTGALAMALYERDRARLKPGVTFEQAQVGYGFGMWRRNFAGQAYPEGSNKGEGIALVPLKRQTWWAQCAEFCWCCWAQ